MSLPGYQSAHVGMSEENLIKAYGSPNQVKHLDSGASIYQYEERFQIGSTTRSLVQVRRYFFYVKNGQVVSKQMRLYDRPGYEFEPGGELDSE